MRRCLKLLLILLWSSALLGEGDVEVVDIDRPNVDGDFGEVKGYSVAVFLGAGWRRDQIEQAIRETRRIYMQCGVSVQATAIYTLLVSDKYLLLENAEQAGLLAEIPQERPMALFVNQTAAADVAYAYRRSAPVAEQGTLWITRKAAPACLGALLAHELGHILLDTARHEAEPGNLMVYSCSYSNLESSKPRTQLSAAQCRRLLGEP